MSKNYNSTLQTNNTDLQAILNTINELPNAGGEQATPIISVNSTNGLITATAGTKTSTHQLAFQAAKTITPGTTNQTAVSSGYYTGGAVTVKGDSNLVAGNIKSGVSIFGVNGNYAGSGGDTSMEDGLVARTLTSYTNNRVTTIGSYAFYSCSSLTTVSFPAAIYIDGYAFCSCSKLTTVSFPKVKDISKEAFGYCSKLTSAIFPCASTIKAYAFMRCFSLTSVSFPEASYIGSVAFRSCSKLTSASFPKLKLLESNAFADCTGLTSFYLTNSSIICSLAASNTFSNTGIWSNKGSIFVPTSLVASYKAKTNWVFFSNRIFGI